MLISADMSNPKVALQKKVILWKKSMKAGMSSVPRKIT